MATTEHHWLTTKPAFWRSYTGPLLVILAIVVIEALKLAGFRLPNPPSILLLIVAYSAFTSGMKAGLVCSALSCVYFAFHFSLPGHLLEYSRDNFIRVMMWAVTVPVMAVMIGFLKKNAQRVGELVSENVALETQIAERKRAELEVRLLQNITSEIGEAEDLHTAFNVVLRRVCETTGWMLGQVWVPNESDRLECLPSFYSSETDLESFHKWSLGVTFARGSGMPGRVWSSRQPVWIKDITSEASFLRSDEARKTRLRSGFGVPVLVGDQLMAVLEFFVREPRDEDEHLVTLVSSVATQLGVVLQRKNIEIALRRSEFQLRAIIDAEPECLMIIRADGTIVQMNAVGLAMIEAVHSEQVVGRPFYNLVQPDYRESFQELVEKVVRGEKANMEFQLTGLKGGHRWMETHAVALPNEKGGLPYVLSLTRDITERKSNEKRLQQLAHFDSLTDLPNRLQFIERLEESMAEADRNERLVGVVFLDLDRFKNINDSLGHDKGDQLLREVALRLSATIRRGDTVARLSGDEFAIVLADMGHVDDAIQVAQKIIDVFHKPFDVEGNDFFVTASMGITLYPFDDRGAQELLRNADVAMYRAKESGKNNFQFYVAEMTERVSERLSLENDLRYALEREQMFIEYQPIAECHTGRILGMEALLRWNHPKRGLIGPATFIPLAEESGSIISIGEWVLRTACEQARQWQKMGFPSLSLAVNISTQQFHQKNLPAVIQRILEETNYNPALLELELTEGLIMKQAESSIRTLRDLVGMDVRISIDDFGTGYSSLSYLKRFPINVLKIDQSFIRDIPRDEDDAAIASTIITMGHNLGLRVVAEGVETAEQLKFARDRRCDAVQGFFLSKPLSVKHFEEFLKSGERLATG